MPDDPSEAFERLNQASVAMLDPLFDPSIGDDPAALAARLGDAIAHCARTAERIGLRSLNYLATLVVPYARRQAGGADWPAVRERLEGWVGDVVAFCAGQLPAAAAAHLVSDPQGWPAFPAVPEQFLTLIAGRLRQDAALIERMYGAGQLTPDAPGPAAQGGCDRMPGAASGMQQAPPSGAGPNAQSPVARADAAARESPAPATASRAERRTVDLGGRAVEVARDELAMLAEAVDALDDEFRAALDALVHDRLPAVQAVELADLQADRLTNLASAARFVGLETLAQLIELGIESLRHWQAAGTVPPAAGVALLRLPVLLGSYLRAPQPEQAGALARALAGAEWPVALAGDEVGPVAERLSQLALVDSRQVTARVSELTPDDLSIEIPTDADAQVVDHLLRELPALSAQFSGHVEAMLAGDRASGAAAQRVAHTLKGAANTVGIRGVATLTHQLEDLLQLIQRDGGAPSPTLSAVLAEAADTLGEMTEAVAGQGDPPGNALALCRALAGWIEALVEGDAPPEGDEAARETAREEAQLPAPAPTPAPVTRAGHEPAGTSPGPARADDDEVLRVPARLVDRMLDLAGEAAILMSQVQEQMSQLAETRGAFRLDAERLQLLSSELERLVDVRGVSLAGRRDSDGFDALELDEFDELHTVSRRIAESGADGKVLEQQLDRQALNMADVVAQLERVQADLRDTVMQSRMVAVATIVPRLQRAVRQAARMAGRQAELAITGAPTALDAHLLQSLIDPLTHLLRNAVDHGIEPPDERRAAGKPATGRISLSFAREGHELAIVCRDDGRGLDLAAVRARALERGLLAPEAQPSDAELARLILLPGFTTRRAASQLSGRGVGMDVVHRGVQSLRGALELASEPGRGLQVSITVPERMVAIPVVVARTPSHVLALSIRGVERILSGDGAVRDERGALRFVHEGGVLAAVRLDEAVGLPAGFFARQASVAAGARRTATAAADEVALIVRRDDGERVAVLAPDLGQTRNVVVRPLPSWLPPVWAVEGAAVLGDGAVAPVVDLPQLLSPQAPSAPVLDDDAFETRPLPVCLVVDDSVSVRRAMEAFLKDIGFAVDAAGDGIEALGRLQHRVPDIAVVDLEMPRMNGLELARALRADARTARVPIVYSDKHRAMAIEAGVDVFLTKPYTEDELASQIRRCLERGGAVG